MKSIFATFHFYKIVIMPNLYIDGEFFKEKDFTQVNLQLGTYENCHFINCNFLYSNLSGFNFIDCEFVDSNLSMAMLGGTVFNNCTFKACKLTGLRFEHCNEIVFTVYFQDCLLNLSSFYKRKIKQVKFISCLLTEVDFTEADATGALFTNCDLAGAIFNNTILEKANFTTARNYSINPQTNVVKKAKFSLPAVVGLLDAFSIIIET